ncbi:hypothetical protein MRB53_011060 [Persea americana]|uniref:Uncharacterized protein n=2 Tax=Persea americana TaxID=3435 RepID=A0ACC2LUC0_PERAE|nr:hypothetical protein MRB53_011059 [Persea americana]KAJ8636793.1 hypothetical protein MRB53_011060 [Persea americana]
MLVPFSSTDNMDSETLGYHFLHKCFITDHIQEKKREKMEESVQPKAYQEHGIHKREAQKFQVEEDNDGFGTPPSIKHRIPANRKSPSAPMKPRRVPMTKEKQRCAWMCIARDGINV